MHTWDVARATGQSAPLLPEVAERALAFMSAMLTPENRGKAFGPEVQVAGWRAALRAPRGVRGPDPLRGPALRPDEA